MPRPFVAVLRVGTTSHHTESTLEAQLHCLEGRNGLNWNPSNSTLTTFRFMMSQSAPRNTGPQQSQTPWIPKPNILESLTFTNQPGRRRLPGIEC